MSADRASTLLAVLVAALWLAAAALGMAGAWLVGLVVSVGLMVVLAAWGTRHRGTFDRSLLAFPIAPWALLWVVSFLGAAWMGERYAGTRPDFTVLGFHPSFAWIVFGYWVGGVVVLTLGFYLRRDRWLSAERWRRFTEDVAAHSTDGDVEEPPGVHPD
ncbi:MAG: hypothetical protein ACFCGT_21155 [Sandaracinaceae bacterium]